MERVTDGYLADACQACSVQSCQRNQILVRSCVAQVEVGFGLYDQVTKRTRWMPWRQKAMKDVEVCDKPRGADNKL